jgi:transglutaminase-like putative cysteine protease
MARLDHPVSRCQSNWLLAAALASALPLATHMPVWLGIATGFAFTWRALLSWRQYHLPPRGLLAFLAFAGSIGVFIEYHTILGRTPGIALLLIFLGLKLLELRTARDAMATLLLCYFLVLGQFLFSQTIPMALQAALTLLVITTALLAANDDRPPVKAQLVRAGILLAQAVPFMLLLFLLFPRVEGPLWGLPEDRRSATSGLSDSMAPGSIAQVSQSDAVAFRVLFKAPEKIPPQAQLYWRGPVMPAFDGRVWRVTQTRAAYATPLWPLRGPVTDYEMTLEPHGKFWLFPLELPAALPADSALTSDYQLLAKQPIRNRIRFEQRALLLARAGREEAPAILHEALALPAEGNPRIRAVAEGWRRQYGNDSAAILAAAQDFFSRQSLIYTLNPPLLGKDSVDQFLFDSKRGFCEHFASAFTFALRAAGVPARVVTGYQGGELNPVDGYLVVRQYDAHAWSEVWLAGQGWVRVDPTAIAAPGRINENVTAALPAGEPLPFLARNDMAWLRELRHRLDAVSNGWNQWVLGYNPQRQRDFLVGLGLDAPDWRSMTAALAVFGGITLLALTFWILHNREESDPALRLWRRFVRKLVPSGILWQPWEGPLDFAARAAEKLPARATEIQEIALEYAVLRYAAGRHEDGLLRLKIRIAAFKP